MTLGSGISLHEPSARSWSQLARTFALFIVGFLTLGACARSPTPEATPTVSGPNTIASQPQPTQTALAATRTAIPEHRIGLGAPDFEDNFEFNTGWETGSSAQGAVSQLGEKLVVSIQGPSATLSSLSPVDELADFFVEIEVQSEICEAGDEFGLMVRTGGAGNAEMDSHYRFLITCDGAVRASRFLLGTEAPMLPITPSTDVLPGAPAVNRIGVSAIGNEFRLYVNDIQAFRLQDGEIPAGRIGVIARARRSAQTTVSFDEFRVWDLATD